MKIKVQESIEQEIEESFVANMAARQHRLLGTVMVTKKKDIIFDFKWLFTKVRKISEGACQAVGESRWLNMINGGKPEWLKWNADIQRIMLGTKFGEDNLPKVRSIRL